MTAAPYTADEVARMARAGACATGLRWMRAAPRTPQELIAHDPGWAYWLATKPDAATAERVDELLALMRASPDLGVRWLAAWDARERGGAR